MKNNLQKIRNSRRMNQEDAAKALGISVNHLSRLENNRSVLQIQLAKTAMNLYDVKLCEIFLPFSCNCVTTEPAEIGQIAN